MINLLRRLYHYWELPPEAKRAIHADRKGLFENDPGPERVVKLSIDWLCRAQDNSASSDGGVARDYSVVNGWASSYPETTGYIVPTMLDYARRYESDIARQSAKRMLDWLVSIQFPEGGFQGGKVDATPVVPVTFNTGQILLGLAAGVKEFGDEYSAPMHTAATWLVETQDDDGCWRKHPTPFAKFGEKAYETHVAWGLLEAARLAPESNYAEAALRNNDWALTQQQDNGWFDNCCLSDASQPLTHTLGYVLRGVWEAYDYSDDDKYLQSAIKLADPLIGQLDETGRLPGRFDRNFKPTVNWSCLTGAVQIAYCWFQLFHKTGDEKYRDAALSANRFVRRTILVEGPEERVGGVKGSFPIDGDYGKFEFLNWAAKFCIDANLAELDLKKPSGN